METVHREPDRLSSTLSERGRQLVGEGGLAGRGDAVDGDAQHVARAIVAEVIGYPSDDPGSFGLLGAVHASTRQRTAGGIGAVPMSSSSSTKPPMLRERSTMWTSRIQWQTCPLRSCRRMIVALPGAM